MVKKLLEEQFRRTTVLTWFFGAVLGGIVLAKLNLYEMPTEVLGLLVVIPLILKKRSFTLLLIAVGIGLALGLWRGGFYASVVESYQQRMGEKLVVEGVVADDSSYGFKRQLEFHIESVRFVDTNAQMPGRMRIRGFGISDIRRGDTVRVAGKLSKGFGNRQGSISFADIQVIKRNSSLLEQVRARFFANVLSTHPEPHGSLGLGFLVGTRAFLPDEVSEQLSITGLTHIVAVSGYNLTVLVRAMRRVFAKQSAFLSVATPAILVGVFLLVTGMSPSIVRASIVSGFSLLAWYVGREFKPLLLLMLSAAVSAVLNPFYVWFDIGWYLSFLAFFGVLIVGPHIVDRCFKKQPKILAQMIIETSSAQLMTTPLIATIFGRVSIIAVAANVLVLPLIPLVMLSTFVAGMAAFVSLTFGSWLALVARYLMSYIFNVIALLSKISWAQISVEWEIVTMLFMYGCVVLWLLLAKKPAKKSFVQEVSEDF